MQSQSHELQMPYMFEAQHHEVLKLCENTGPINFNYLPAAGLWTPRRLEGRLTRFPSPSGFCTSTFPYPPVHDQRPEGRQGWLLVLVLLFLSSMECRFQSSRACATSLSKSHGRPAGCRDTNLSLFPMKDWGACELRNSSQKPHADSSAI